MAIKTIGTDAGRDYSNVNSWITNHLVGLTFTENEIGEVYNDGKIAQTTGMDFTSVNNAAPYWIILRAAPGHSFYDNPNSRLYPSVDNGVLIESDHSGRSIDVDQSRFLVEGIQFTSKNFFSGNYYFYNNNSTTTLARRCMFSRDNSSGGSATFQGRGWTIDSCLIISHDAEGSALFTQYEDNLVYNSTLIGANSSHTGNAINASGGGTVTIYNSAIFGFNGMGNATLSGDWNVSDVTGGPGSNNIGNATFNDAFIDNTADFAWSEDNTNDYRAVVDGPLQRSGAMSYYTALDLLGNLRDPDKFYVGAHTPEPVQYPQRTYIDPSGMVVIEDHTDSRIMPSGLVERGASPSQPEYRTYFNGTSVITEEIDARTYFNDTSVITETSYEAPSGVVNTTITPDAATLTLGTTAPVLSAFPLNWNRKARLRVNPADVSGASNHTSFLTLLTENSLPSEMLDADGSFPAINGGADIRFSTDSAGQNQIACEVVSFVTNNNPALGTAEIWVKVPTLYHAGANTDTEIFVWYNKPDENQVAATDTYGRNAVWSDYVFAWHGSGATDSTGNHPMTEFGTPSDVTGPWGGAAKEFDGSTDYYEADYASDFDAGTPRTIQAWLYDVTPGADFVPIFSNRNSSNQGWGLTADTRAGSDWQVVYQGVAAYQIPASVQISDSSWYSYHATIDASRLFTAYEDGSARPTTTTVSASPSVSTDDPRIGREGGSSVYFDGRLSNIRIRDDELSSDWIATEYNNQSDVSSFWSSSSAENGDSSILAPAAASLTLTGQTPTLLTGKIIQPAAATITFSSIAPFVDPHPTIFNHSGASVIYEGVSTSGPYSGTLNLSLTIPSGMTNAVAIVSVGTSRDVGSSPSTSSIAHVNAGAITEIGSASDSPASDLHTDLTVFIMTQLTAGTADLDVTFDNAANHYAIAVDFYEDVDQVDPIGATDTDAANASQSSLNSLLITTTQTDSRAVIALHNRGPSSSIDVLVGEVFRRGYADSGNNSSGDGSTVNYDIPAAATGSYDAADYLQKSSGFFRYGGVMFELQKQTNLWVSPAAATLTFTGYAPTVAIGEPAPLSRQVYIAGVGFISEQGTETNVLNSGVFFTENKLQPTSYSLQPAAAQLTLATSTVEHILGASHEPAADSLVITPSTPVVIETIFIQPVAATLTLTTYVPVAEGAGVKTPVAASLSLSTETVVIERDDTPGRQELNDPEVGTATIYQDASDTPTASEGAAEVGSATTGLGLTLTAATLTLTGYAPDVEGAVGAITPDAAVLTFSTSTPTVGENEGRVSTAASLTLSTDTTTVAENQGRVPAAGTLTFTTYTADVKEDAVVTSAAASLTFTGYTPTLGGANVETPAAATLTFSTETVALFTGQVITPAADTLTLIGQTSGIIEERIVTPVAASLVFTSQAPNVFDQNSRQPSAAALVLTGQTSGIIEQRIVTPAAGTLSFASEAPTVAENEGRTPDAAVISITGQATTVQYNEVRESAAASVTITGYAPEVAENQGRVPSAAQIIFGTEAPGKIEVKFLAPTAASLSFTGYAPGAGSQGVIAPPSGALAFTPYTPDVGDGEGKTPASGTITTTGYQPSVTESKVVSPSSDTLSLTTENVNVVRSYVISPNAEQLTLVGYAPVPYFNLAIVAGVTELNGGQTLVASVVGGNTLSTDVVGSQELTIDLEGSVS